MKSLRPFWRYFGAKWKIAGRYPAPLCGTIVEPFAGAAVYSLRWPDRNVVLVEKYPAVAEVWRWLIGASRADALAIPYVECVDDLPSTASDGVRLLVGFMLGAGDTRPRARMSPMVRRDGGWNRERLAEQVVQIKHWRIIEGDYTGAPDIEATWFVDPPYQEAGGKSRRPGARGRVRYPHGSDALDFAALGSWCRTRRGQAIVCENVGTSWLPFEPLADAQSVGHGISREAVWTSEATEVVGRGPAPVGDVVDRRPPRRERTRSLDNVHEP